MLLKNQGYKMKNNTENKKLNNVDDLIEFGDKPDAQFINRPSAYAIIPNDHGQILALNVGGNIHLPGGGIDEGENPEETIKREALEEAGCNITDLKYIGKANQYFKTSKIGPLRKSGVFYFAKLLSIDNTASIEDDHQIVWLSPEDFIASDAADFQKWAVSKLD